MKQKQFWEELIPDTYSRSSLSDLSALAQSEGKNLWMSEVDGSYTAGTNAGEMSAALGLAGAMMTEVNGLKCSAWILWNAIDMHADSSEYGQSWVNKGSANDFLSMDALEKHGDPPHPKATGDLQQQTMTMRPLL